MELPGTMGESGLRQETELLRQQLESAQAHLKQEKHWRVNATKVSERRKLQMDKLKQECSELKQECAGLGASLDAVGARANYLHGEILKVNPDFRLPSHLLQ